MKSYQSDNSDKDNKSILEESAQRYASLEDQENARLRNAVFMPDVEKFRLFCRMMRVGKMLASAKVTHKPA